jgi:hypothetical protein
MYIYNKSKNMTKINAKQAIDKIKKMLFTEGSPDTGTAAKDASAGTSYTLKDGTPVSIKGGLVKGSQVLISGADGDTPAPDGELELSDGTTLSITGGLITDIITPGQEVDQQNGGEAPDESQFWAVGNLENKISSIEKEINAFRARISNQALAQKEILDLVGKLAELPADEPASKPKNVFAQAKSKQDSKMRQLADSLQKMKKATH